MKRLKLLHQIVWTSLAFIFAFANTYSKLLMLPYLQAVTQNSIVIMAETDNQEPPFAIIIKQDGTKQIYQPYEFKIAENRREKTYVHRILVDNLNPNTKYSYFVVHQNDTTNIFQFQTSVPEGLTYRFAVTGDGRSNPPIHSKITSLISKFQPRFIIYTGDLCYSGKYSEWKNEFFTPEAQKVYSTIPFFNALGNHEAQTELTKVFLQEPNPSSNSEYYYSFDFGDVHFLILNTEGPVDENSKQYKFAQADLENTTKTWKIVTFHIPAYSAGGHNPSKTMQKMTSKIFEPAGVSLVFNGHNHFYQRSFVNGIYHIVFGGGGAPLYEPKNDYFVQKSFKDYHFGIVDVSSTSITINVYDIRENLIDKLEITR
ncbi:MAG: metallophosphoesterase [Candidatus Kapaibacteriales bacterium]